MAAAAIIGYELMVLNVKQNNFLLTRFKKNLKSIINLEWMPEQFWNKVKNTFTVSPPMLQPITPNSGEGFQSTTYLAPWPLGCAWCRSERCEGWARSEEVTWRRDFITTLPNGDRHLKGHARHYSISLFVYEWKQNPPFRFICECMRAWTHN